MTLFRTLCAACLVISGCAGELPPSPLSCGPGTVRIGDRCLPSGSPDAGVVADYDGGEPIPGDDAGEPTSDDAGGWWTGTEPPPGCDEASGECDAWEAEILAALREGCAGLTIDPALQAIADEHAGYQAENDRMSATGPGGTVFDQLNARDISYRDAAALFSVTRDGPADVVARWEAGASAPILGNCYTHAGIAFETSATEASYVTVVLVVR